MKILLVDDSKSARYALRLQLQRHGMMVETCDAAEAALERIRSTPPDAIFMDHTMPGMNGFEALEILKSSPATAHIPVVMCTSNEDPEFIAQATKKGALAILAKSTAPEKLENLLDRLQKSKARPQDTGTATAAVAPSDQTHLEAAQGITAALDDERFDARMRALAEAFVEQRIQRLTGDLIAKIDERIEVRAQAALGPFVEDLVKRLAEDLIAKTNQRLVTGLEREAERLNTQVLEAQSRHAQQAADRLANEILPQALRQQHEQDQQAMAQMVKKLADTSVKTQMAEPSFLRNILDTLEAGITESTEEIAKRKAMEIAERVASEQADAVAKLLVQPSKVTESSLYLFSAGAALVGVVSAAVVYFLLG